MAGGVWIGFDCLKIGSGGGLNEPLCSIKGREFHNQLSGSKF